MAVKMILRWRNPDASADVNLRFKDVFKKGFVTMPEGSGFEGKLTGSGGLPLQVTVAPFVCVSFDGAVVLSDAAATIAVTDLVKNYVVLRAKYRLLDSPVLEITALSETAYQNDPEQDFLHVLGVVDLTGSPHTSVSSSLISYVERDEVDQQGRSSWKEPVASALDLPVGPGNMNRHGDIRLDTDTGSLFWWDNGLQIWKVFDEDAVIAHRDHEHGNGITGDSDPNTLLPSTMTNNMVIGPIPAGSGYTANGRYVTGIVGGPGAILIPAPAVRGLVQVWADQDGVLSSSYRVAKDADPLDISSACIVDISDNHPVSGASFALRFTSPNLLSWDNGEPVVVNTSGRFRLFRPNYIDWIDVQMNGALPGTSQDNYVVNASQKTDGNLLIAHFFVADVATVALGTDKRSFGNVGLPELSDTVMREAVHPQVRDLRGDMVFSGGACSDAGGLQLRVTGPIVVYLDGRRYEAPGSYTGETLAANDTSYVYVELVAGVPTLTVSLTDPTTLPPFHFAPVAEVTTTATIAGGSITDLRDPQIIVGQATRNSNIVLSKTSDLRWVEADGELQVRKGGSVDNATVRTGNAVITDEVLVGGQATIDGDVELNGAELNTSSTTKVGFGQSTGDDVLVNVFDDTPAGTALRVRQDDATGVIASFLGAGGGDVAVLAEGAITLSKPVVIDSGSSLVVGADIAADGGLGRSSPGVLSIGTDVNTTSTTLGKVGGNVHVEDTLTVGGSLTTDSLAITGAFTATDFVNPTSGLTAYARVGYATDMASGQSGPWQGKATSSPSVPGASAFDSNRNVIVLFNSLGETWEFDGTSWVQRFFATRPAPRSGAGMTYDKARAEVVLFGGTVNGSDNNETWTYNGSSWTQKAPATNPVVRHGCSLGYHETQGYVLLSGGRSLGGSAVTDSHTWDGTNWTPKGGGATNRVSISPLVWHPGLGTLVFWGGQQSIGSNHFNNLRKWDPVASGGSWVDQTSDSGGAAGTGETASTPARGIGGMLAFDTARSKLVLYGGSGDSNDHWEYTVAGGWVKRAETATPGSQNFGVLQYHEALSKLVFFGASGTHVYTDPNWAQVVALNRTELVEVAFLDLPHNSKVLSGLAHAQVVSALLDGTLGTKAQLVRVPNGGNIDSHEEIAASTPNTVGGTVTYTMSITDSSKTTVDNSNYSYAVVLRSVYGGLVGFAHVTPLGARINYRRKSALDSVAAT
jgi:hypothetical protein